MYRSRLTRAEGSGAHASFTNSDGITAAYTGTLRSHLSWVDGIRAALAAHRDGSRRLFLDLDGNGVFASDESQPAKQATFWLPHPSPELPPLPLLLRVEQTTELAVTLAHSGIVVYRGTLQLGERRIRAAFQVDGESGLLHPRRGRIYFDLDGDGNFADDPYSLEAVRLRDEDYVFRAGDDYFSLDSVDLQQARFAVKTRPAEDYTRIEIRRGVQLPDFVFVDLAGTHRRLSDFAGHYVLLDLWGSWCQPCRDEARYLAEAQSLFYDRGLRILGLNWDDDVNKAEAFISETNTPGIHARKASIEDLVTNRLRITKFPTYLLLDPRRRIITTGRPPDISLHGERIVSALEELLPSQPSGLRH